MIPDWAWVHTVEVEPFLGRNATGPAYGPASVYRCVISDSAKLIRRADGREITASCSVYLPHGPAIPLDSRVTLRGRITTVVDVRDRDGGDLPVPSHLQLLCE